MAKYKGINPFKYKIDRTLLITCLILALFGSFMIISAEMGEQTGDLPNVLFGTVKQCINLLVAILGLFFAMTSANLITKLNIYFYNVAYVILLVLLIIPRAFAPSGGAYAWIIFGPVSLQPSEFAKLFIILYAAKLFSKENENNVNNLKKFFILLGIYFLTIVVIEKDFGSATVLLIIGYVCALIAPFKDLKKYQNWMILLIGAFILFAVFLLSKPGTALLEHFSDSYQVLRFLSSANPFNYQYDSGYHLIMSLVSIANGNWFGLGFGKSIHKFMNFPNPSTDFILPVIIEEMGLVFGFIPIVVGYGIIFYRLAYHSLRCNTLRGKIIISGSLLYFVIHFFLNVGGVSGLIPLTGVPLLLISSGGSSLISCLMAIGFSEFEINNYITLQNENH